MSKRRKIVVLTGAGISAESGLSTFRDSGGLWEQYAIDEVATIDAWHRNPALVLEFYNARRRQLKDVQPNAAHKALVKLEEKFDVHIITQNVDDLHERAGSSRVLHLHGELKKARSSIDPTLIYEIEGDIKLGDKCEKGSQLRPHIVWFGELVPEMENAVKIVRTADIFLVIGTSLVVYPAASLVYYVRENTPIYVVDPKTPAISGLPNVTYIQEKASEGVPELVEQLLKEQ